MLDMSKIESGKLELAEQEFDLLEVVERMYPAHSQPRRGGRTCSGACPAHGAHPPFRRPAAESSKHFSTFCPMRRNSRPREAASTSQSIKPRATLSSSASRIPGSESPRRICPAPWRRSCRSRPSWIGRMRGPVLGCPWQSAMTELHGGTLTIKKRTGSGNGSRGHASGRAGACDRPRPRGQLVACP